MKTETLGFLLCPYCGGRFQLSSGLPAGGDGIEYGVLTCACSNFPVVAGIPIFKREGRVDVMNDTQDSVFRSGPRVDVLIELLRSGLHEKALMLLLIPPDRSQTRWLRAAELLPKRYRRRVRDLVSRAWPRRRMDVARRLLSGTPTALEVFDLYFRRLGMWPAELYNHFGFLFGQPRHLSGLSLASLLPTSSGPVLDLACGFGHFLHSWTTRRPGHPFVGLDRNFYLLYVAKRWMAPAADYVCSEADLTLPFATGSFGGVFCSDAFHLFLRKVQCAAEIRRILGAKGTVILSRLGNALVKPNEGYELSPEAYGNLFDGLDRRLISDRAVLARYLQKLGPPLKDPVRPDSLAEDKWVSLVAGGESGLFQDHGRFESWPHGVGRLRVNPLYRERERDATGDVTLEFAFPSEHYRRENSDCRTYMPEKVRISRRLHDDLEKGMRPRDGDDLVRACVLLGVPDRYF